MNLSSIIKEKAESLGFAAVGCAPARALSEERPNLDEYLSKGWNGTMEWIRKSNEQRLDPALRFKDARSIVSLAINYFNETWEVANPGPYGRLSRYVYGGDYHSVIKAKLRELAGFMKKEGASLASHYVDDGPVLEKKWAALCGIGWRGKNSLIFNREYGSWIFLSEIITDLDLHPTGGEIESRCGKCTICIESCPTGAIEKPYMVNASKCISCWTIETDEILSPDMKGKIGKWIYGCDICQEVCPQNAIAKITKESQFRPKKEILDLSLTDIIRIDEKSFQRTFRGSALRRGGRERLLRNASIALDNLQKETS